MTTDNTSRRRFIKGAGAASVIALAGCGGDGGSGDGSDDSGGDDSGSDTGGDTGDGGSDREIRIAAAPLGILTLPWEYVTENGIFQEEMEAAGYPNYNIQWTWEEKVLGASGQADIIPTIGSIEAARLGAERDINVTVNAAGMLTQYQGWVVEAGSQYDPDEVGGEQQAMDNLVENDAPVGMGPWAGGHIPPDQIVIQEKYGYEMSQGGDFNINNADYAALAQLLENGDVVAAITGPPLGAPQMMESTSFDHSSIYWLPPALEDLGYQQTNFALANVVTTQQFAADHSPATEAFMRAMHRGLSWMQDQDFSNVIEDDSDLDALGANSEAEAEFILDWAWNNYKQPLTPPDFALTDEYIQADRQALSDAESIGQIPSGWEETLEYNKLPIS